MRRVVTWRVKVAPTQRKLVSSCHHLPRARVCVLDGCYVILTVPCVSPGWLVCEAVEPCRSTSCDTHIGTLVHASPPSFHGMFHNAHLCTGLKQRCILYTYILCTVLLPSKTDELLNRATPASQPCWHQPHARLRAAEGGKQKRRTPAWCDRVLWLSGGSGGGGGGAGSLTQLWYRRGELTASDHKPVAAGFMMQVCGCGRGAEACRKGCV